LGEHVGIILDPQLLLTSCIHKISRISELKYDGGPGTKPQLRQTHIDLDINHPAKL